MRTEDLEELVIGLHGLSMAQAGTIAAHRATIDALIGAIGLSLPPLLDVVSDNLDGLQSVLRNDLEPESHAAFDNTVAAFQDGLRILQR